MLIFLSRALPLCASSAVVARTFNQVHKGPKEDLGLGPQPAINAIEACAASYDGSKAPLRPPLDIQETLKILRFRFKRNVGIEGARESPAGLGGNRSSFITIASSSRTPRQTASLLPGTSTSFVGQTPGFGSTRSPQLRIDLLADGKHRQAAALCSWAAR